MVQTFLLSDTITNEKTVKFMQRDIITSTIAWHLGLVGSNNFGEHTSFSPFTLPMPTKYTFSAVCYLCSYSTLSAQCVLPIPHTDVAYATWHILYSLIFS